MTVDQITNRTISVRPRARAECNDYRRRMLLEAVVTAGAVVAMADGWVETQERAAFADFIRRNAWLHVDSSYDAGAVFDSRLCTFEQPGGMSAAIAGLQRVAGSKRARLILDVAEDVAAADDYVKISELNAIALLRRTLLPPARRASPCSVRVHQ